MDSKIIEIFYLVDEFCKEFELAKEGHILSEKTSVKRRNRKFTMSDSEVITIVIPFHLKKYRCLKHFYTMYVQNHMQVNFPKALTYNRFMELHQKALMPMAVFLQLCCLGKCIGVSFIDSTPIRVCHIRREFQHKNFKGLATKGQCSMGRCFGFKLHIVINDKGEILDFLFTQGNVDDREPLKNKNFHDKIFRNWLETVYISKTLFDELFIDGIHLISKIRKNMKNSLMLLQDKNLLRKRALIETINDELKNICQIEQTWYRNFENFLPNLFSGLIAYSFLDKRPRLNLKEIIVQRQICTLILLMYLHLTRH
jgi:hypothetical protein